LSATSIESELCETAPSIAAGRAQVAPAPAPPVTVIEPRGGLLLLNWRDALAFRDLLRFLVWREIKVRYAQSAVGIGWAVIQPVFSMLIFTVVFGKLARVDSDGAPYALFALAALVPWTYFSNAVTDGVNALVGDANTLRKVYFPRVFMPLSAVLAKLVDFGIAMGVLATIMAFLRQPPTLGVLALPLLVLLMMTAALAISVWLSAMAVQYRDVKHALPFLVQLGMYASPVVFATSAVPAWRQVTTEWWISPQLIYALNPMVGVIEGFRSALLGTQTMPWTFIGIGFSSATAVLLTGLAYFHSKERLFADVA